MPDYLLVLLAAGNVVGLTITVVVVYLLVRPRRRIALEDLACTRLVATGFSLRPEAPLDALGARRVVLDGRVRNRAVIVDFPILRTRRGGHRAYTRVRAPYAVPLDFGLDAALWSAIFDGRRPTVGRRSVRKSIAHSTGYLREMWDVIRWQDHLAPFLDEPWEIISTHHEVIIVEDRIEVDLNALRRRIDLAARLADAIDARFGR